MKKANLAFLMLIIFFSEIPAGFVCDNQNYSEIKEINDTPKTAGVSVLWNFTSLESVYFTYTDMSDDGKYTVIVNDKNIYLLNNTGGGKPKFNITASPNAVSHCSISKNGKYFIVYMVENGTYDKKIYLYNTSSPLPMKKFKISDTVSCLKMSDDGYYFAVGMRNGFLLFNISGTKPMINYSVGDDVISIAFSEDNSFIAVGTESNDKSLYLFFKTSAAPLWKKTLLSRISRLAISSDGTYIATGDSDYIYLFNKASPNPVWKYYFNDPPDNIQITPVNQYIFVCNGYGLHLFTVSSNNCIWALRGDQFPFWGWSPKTARISDDEKYIIAPLWDTNKKENLTIISVSNKEFLWNHLKKNQYLADFLTSSLGNYFLQEYGQPDFVVLWHTDFNFGTKSEEINDGNDSESKEPATAADSSFIIMIIATITGLAGITVIVTIIALRKKKK